MRNLFGLFWFLLSVYKDSEETTASVTGQSHQHLRLLGLLHARVLEGVFTSKVNDVSGTHLHPPSNQHVCLLEIECAELPLFLYL